MSQNELIQYQQQQQQSINPLLRWTFPNPYLSDEANVSTPNIPSLIHPISY